MFIAWGQSAEVSVKQTLIHGPISVLMVTLNLSKTAELSEKMYNLSYWTSLYDTVLKDSYLYKIYLNILTFPYIINGEFLLEFTNCQKILRYTSMEKVL